MKQLKAIIVSHQKSPMEFSRGGNFVIADDEFNMETLDVVHMKEKTKLAKDFLEEMTEIVNSKI